jgi:hypothetical protein
MQFECGTRILRVIHGRDARATSPNCITTDLAVMSCLSFVFSECNKRQAGSQTISIVPLAATFSVPGARELVQSVGGSRR